MHDCHRKELCDPRSLCFASSTGTGVQCSCDIPQRGIITRPGTLPDGSQCLQKTRAELKVESSEYRQIIAKPTTSPMELALVLQAEGEQPARIVYSMSVTVLRGATQNETVAEHTWEDCRGRSQTFFGQEVEWTQQSPEEETLIVLSRETLRYLYKLPFRMQVACRTPTACVMDGDEVRTNINFLERVNGSRADSLLASSVTIFSRIASKASCVHSNVSVQASVSQTENYFRALIGAIDVDGLPISHTFQAFQVMWDGTPIAVQRGALRHEYIAVIAPASRQSVGQHQLTVLLLDGYSETTQSPVSSCELLRTSVNVTEARCGIGTELKTISTALKQCSLCDGQRYSLAEQCLPCEHGGDCTGAKGGGYTLNAKAGFWRGPYAWLYESMHTCASGCFAVQALLQDLYGQ